MSNIAIARVVDGLVVNLEVASAEWIAENTDDTTRFIPIGNHPVSIGMAVDQHGNFGPAPLTPPSEESIAWAEANGDTSWQDLQSSQG